MPKNEIKIYAVELTGKRRVYLNPDLKPTDAEIIYITGISASRLSRLCEECHARPSNRNLPYEVKGEFPNGREVTGFACEPDSTDMMCYRR